MTEKQLEKEIKRDYLEVINSIRYNEKKRKNIIDAFEIDENIIFFDNPSYDDAIIGISSDNRICYSYEKMIDSLSLDMNENDSKEIVDEVINNCLYKDKGPIILYEFCGDVK